MAWTVTILLVLHCSLQVTTSTLLPRPWLTIHRSASVLRITCAPPPQASSWKAVHDLKVSALLPKLQTGWGNITLASILLEKQEPVTNDKFPLSSATFTGSWEHNSPSLTLVMKFSEKEEGQYYCSGNYQIHDGHWFIFSNSVDLRDSQTQAKKDGKFEAHVIDVHEVKVTWRKPEEDKFQEASVSRVMTDGKENDISAPLTLFATVGIKHFEFDPSVLLAKFTENGNNLSMTVFAKSRDCEPFCRYDCSVPYAKCIGPDARFCVCTSKATLPAMATQSTEGWLIAVIILSVVVVALLIVASVFLLNRYKRKADVKKKEKEKNVEGDKGLEADKADVKKKEKEKNVNGDKGVEADKPLLSNNGNESEQNVTSPTKPPRQPINEKKEEGIMKSDANIH